MSKRVFDSITAPQGFLAAGGAFGIKPSGKPDLAIIAADRVCRAAAVFTRNQIPSEPVQLGRRHMADGRCRAIVCNAGNANASTGRRGLADATAMCRRVAKHLGCETKDILACSTGIIGEHLPMDRINTGIDALAGKLVAGPRADRDVAHAILTTDLVPKATVRRLRIGSKTVTIGGVAKGSGMIEPNMATMLAFLTTDADISLPLLRRALKQAVDADASFNRISVDSDTSPSDTVAVLASGAAGNPPIRKTSRAFDRFAAALADVCRDLAYRVIADGEGAERVIRVEVAGARTGPDAVRLARTVANSPLVKTAIHGGDPNWGRLTMAAGKSQAKVVSDRLVVKIAGQTVYRRGAPARTDLKRLERAMKASEVTIRFDLGLGTGSTVYLGCDLSRQYVTINADYHT